MPNFKAKNWSEFDWPEWVLPEIKKQVESFWGESQHRNPQEWIDNAVREHAPAFGLRVRMKNFSGALVSGNYVFAWNNIGRLVNDDGKVEYVGVGPFEVSRNGMWCKPESGDYFTVANTTCTGRGCPHCGSELLENDACPRNCPRFSFAAPVM